MLAALFLTLTLFSVDVTGTPGATQSERIRAVEDSLLSPCCYGGPVSTHMSDIAAQMRQEITQMVAEGKSDKEIRQFYVKQYGEQVLAEPEGTKRVILYALPVSVTVAGAVVVIAFLRKALHRKNEERSSFGARAEPDAAVLKKVRCEVGEI